jgi:hypothetical protein
MNWIGSDSYPVLPKLVHPDCRLSDAVTMFVRAPATFCLVNVQHPALTNAMATSSAAFDTKRPRILHDVLAALISFLLLFSLFHCCCVDGDEGTLTISAAQTNCDISGKPAPASPTPHCCHCLAHATTVAPPQHSAVAIEYVAGRYGFATASLPDATDLSSPFEPPRA